MPAQSSAAKFLAMVPQAKQCIIEQAMPLMASLAVGSTLLSRAFSAIVLPLEHNDLAIVRTLELDVAEMAEHILAHVGED